MATDIISRNYLTFFLLFIVVSFIQPSFAKVENGDVLEFYISAKNVPSTPGGSGSYYFGFGQGVLRQDGTVVWLGPTFSGFQNGPDPIWRENVLNETYLQISWQLYAYWRIAFFEQTVEEGSRGNNLDYWKSNVAILDWVYESCLSGKPYEQKSDKGFTYYYHCIRHISKNGKTGHSESTPISRPGYSRDMKSDSRIYVLRHFVLLFVLFSFIL